LKLEYKKSVLKVSNLKQSLKTTIKDSILTLNHSTLDRDMNDTYNELARHHSAFTESFDESTEIMENININNENGEEDSDEIDELEESLSHSANY